MRAVRVAMDAPDAAEALAGILGEAVPAVGADAGAVVERGVVGCRDMWGCAPAELYPLLEERGPISGALTRLEDWVDSTLLLSRVGGVEHLLLAPLRVRGQATGALALMYRGAARPGAEARERAAAFAGLAALVAENGRLYDEAREALQARDHFLTALNHELRTPATALLLEADLLRSDAALPPRLSEALHEVEERVHEVILVLRRVLDLGSLGDEATPAGVEVIQPRQVVATLMRRVEPAAKRKNLTLSLFVPRNLPPLQTDTARFSRILLHLFSNAIKYTAQGGVEVRLERSMRTISRSKQEPVLVVRVKDTGRGIPPHELERIFEPFAQVDEGARTDSRTRGLGLGLPLARQLARSLGGDVLVESTPGMGTLASLVVPYRQRLATG